MGSSLMADDERLLCERANLAFGRAAEVQGLHILAAAFEDEADRRSLFFIL